MRIVKTLAFGCLSLLSLGIGVNSAGAASNALQPGVARFDDAASLQSVAKAYRFLHRMLNKYAKGSTTRLVQSFDGGPLKGFTDAVTYDDALFVDALLARSTPGDLASAQVVGNAFLFVQAHDQAGDGRLRAAYAPKPLQSPGDVIVRDNTSDVGNMAWVGQALLQLYARTSDTDYLDGALAIARWIVANAYDGRGNGGYTGGYTARGSKIEWKSTEHNIDIYAFFTMLATESGQSEWSANAAWAAQFVASMWSAPDGRFFAGTLNDGKTPNTSFKPEDVNSWSYLAFANPVWAGAPSWDVTQLAVDRNGFSGVSFCSGDRSGVWFEGTAHLADTLELRNGPGDQAQARAYLADVAHAQTSGLNADGLGVIAASKNGLSDCDGDHYFASLHVGATAWYVMAAQHANPFVLINATKYAIGDWRARQESNLHLRV